MRILLAAFTIAAFAPSMALASSFVTVAPPERGATPSILQMDAPADPAKTITTFIGKLIQLATPAAKEDQSRMATVSASVVSFGEAEPPVTMEKVAAIGKRQNLPEPMVMRGGVTGGSFSAPEGAPDVAVVPDKPVQQQAAPDEAVPSAVRGGGDGGAAPDRGQTMADTPAAPRNIPTASAPPPAQPTVQREGPKPQ